MFEFNLTALMGFNFVLGLAITVFALKIGNATKNCTDTKVNNSIKGLLSVGLILMSVSGTSFACGCAGNALINNNIHMIFGVFSLALGVVLVTLASIVHNKCGVPKSDTGLIIALGSVMIAVSVGYLGMKAFKRVRGGGVSFAFDEFSY